MGKIAVPTAIGTVGGIILEVNNLSYVVDFYCLLYTKGVTYFTCLAIFY